jgi:hypothetical protein
MDKATEKMVITHYPYFSFLGSAMWWYYNCSPQPKLEKAKEQDNK